jgi:hypothetical protein
MNASPPETIAWDSRYFRPRFEGDAPLLAAPPDAISLSLVPGALSDKVKLARDTLGAYLLPSGDTHRLALEWAPGLFKYSQLRVALRRPFALGGTPGTYYPPRDLKRWLSRTGLTWVRDYRSLRRKPDAGIKREYAFSAKRLKDYLDAGVRVVLTIAPPTVLSSAGDDVGWSHRDWRALADQLDGFDRRIWLTLINEPHHAWTDTTKPRSRDGKHPTNRYWPRQDWRQANEYAVAFGAELRKRGWHMIGTPSMTTLSTAMLDEWGKHLLAVGGADVFNLIDYHTYSDNPGFVRPQLELLNRLALQLRSVDRFRPALIALSEFSTDIWRPANRENWLASFEKVCEVVADLVDLPFVWKSIAPEKLTPESDDCTYLVERNGGSTPYLEAWRRALRLP